MNDKAQPPKKSLLYRIFHLHDPQADQTLQADSQSIMARSRRHYESESDCESEPESTTDHVQELERSKDYSSFPRLFRRPSSANLMEQSAGAISRQRSMHEKFKCMTQESEEDSDAPRLSQRRPSASHFKDFFRLRGANASTVSLDQQDASSYSHHKTSPLVAQIRYSSSENSVNQTEKPAVEPTVATTQIVDQSPYKSNDESMFLSPHYSPSHTDFTSPGRPSVCTSDQSSKLNISDHLASTPQPINARRHSSHSLFGEYLTPDHSPVHSTAHPDKGSPVRKFFSLSRVGSSQSLSAQGKLSRSNSEISLTEKYGKRGRFCRLMSYSLTCVESVIGKGGQAVVKLCCPVGSDKKYAVKEFRTRRKDEGKVRTLLCLVFV